MCALKKKVFFSEFRLDIITYILAGLAIKILIFEIWNFLELADDIILLIF
jgi:hypothetical protein